MHVIKLDGYNATPENGEKLKLGTFDSFGEEQLQIVKAPDWVNLSVIATFNPPNRKPVQAVVDSVTGVIKVPKEATAGWYGVGTIVFVGIADGVQRISSDVEYIVRRHSNASGTEPAEPTPSVVEQILTEAQNANVNSAEAKKLATNAKDIAQSVRTDADNGKFNGKDGAKGDKGDTGPQGPVGPQGPQGEKGKDAEIPEDYPQIRKDVSQLKEDIGDIFSKVGHLSYGENLFVASKIQKGKYIAVGSGRVGATVSISSSSKYACLSIPIDGEETYSIASVIVDVSYAKTTLIAPVDSAQKLTMDMTEYVDKDVDTRNSPIIITTPKTTKTLYVVAYSDSGWDVFPSGLNISVNKIIGAVEGSIPKAVEQNKKDIKEIKADAKATGDAIGELKQNTTVLQKRQNVLVGSETGNPIAVDDAFSAPLCGLTVYGKSTQDGTPSVDKPVPIVSAGDSGTIVLTLGDGDSKTQTLTLSTPNGLPGIPVPSDGNYTDQNGQQWVCDEVDLERGVRVQRVRIKALNPNIAWSYRKTNRGNNNFQTRIYSADVAIINKPCFCNILHYTSNVWDDIPKNLPKIYANDKEITISFPPNSEYSSLEAFKQLLTDVKSVIYYALATPIETPLTPAEIAAYKALTAYGPDTVVQASDGAGVKLEYQRDVDIAIKREVGTVNDAIDVLSLKVEKNTDGIAENKAAVSQLKEDKLDNPANPVVGQILRVKSISDTGEITLETVSGGLPEGGKAGQVLVKKTVAEGDCAWVDPQTATVRTSMDDVALAGAKYILGEQAELSITMPTDAQIGQEIMVVFSSGQTACTLAVDLDDFDFLPKANSMCKIVFLCVAADTWLVDAKEG
ncbi:hypothetical protein [uncultured Gemmiger sp.]|jgi:hypothetical protein|uniref:hypothetical protein n=1 Tax=uncultured Gemmiger sp. TaxID=1623490 RepID=UPI002804E656|nr:hypothetical protein [uncultured Gemmiger sp.]